MKQSYCVTCDKFVSGRHFPGRRCAVCAGTVRAASARIHALDGQISLPTDLRNARLEIVS